MPESSSLIIQFGVDPSNMARIRDEIGRFMRMNEAARAYTEMQTGLAAALFTQELREEFVKGTDKQGISHNKTGATLRSIRIEIQSMVATIYMGGGGVFVEYGRSAIVAAPGKVLSFVDSDGNRVFTKRVGPARRDDFVGRAMGRVDLSQLLERVAYGTFSETTGYAVDRHGFRFTGGQQLRGGRALGKPAA